MRTLLLALLLSTVAVHAQTTLAYDGFWADTASGDALVTLPEGYDADDREWPLLIFLHGAGERGSDLSLVGIHGPLKERREGRDLPFVIVAPQVSEGGRWSVGRVAATLDAAIAAYRIDESRVYLTGLSMGGFGTWEAIEHMPERFAAAVPVCGGGNPIGLAEARDVPVWAFHGDADPVVPLAASAVMVNALEASGGQVQFTVYPGVGHDSWTETYANPEVYEWLLSHQLESTVLEDE